jgi:hypothetical protein
MPTLAEDDPDNDDSPDNDAEVQPASFFGDRIRDQLKQHPDIEQNIRGTLGGVVGSGFTPQEIDTLKNRAIDAVSPLDALTFKGLQSTSQWTAMDGLLRRMPQDTLGQRAYSAFKAGLANGKIRVR